MSENKKPTPAKRLASVEEKLDGIAYGYDMHGTCIESINFSDNTMAKLRTATKLGHRLLVLRVSNVNNTTDIYAINAKDLLV